MECNEMKELFAVMVLYRMNFENLHWNSIGEEFDNAHKEISTEYYEKINTDIDIVAEMLARMRINPMNYKEVWDFIEGGEKDYMLVSSSSTYMRDDIVQMSQRMLGDICKAIENAHECECMKDIKNMGIKSTLEAMYDYYDLQVRYINGRKCRL